LLQLFVGQASHHRSLLKVRLVPLVLQDLLVHQALLALLVLLDHLALLDLLGSQVQLDLQEVLEHLAQLVCKVLLAQLALLDQPALLDLQVLVLQEPQALLDPLVQLALQDLQDLLV